MYEYLKGVLTKISPTYIVVEVAGIGYILNTANPYSFSHLVNQDVKVYVHQVVREDSQMLYAFISEEEKNIFLKLISVSGIGPKSALAILATADNDGLVDAIHSSNINYLIKFPGVGKKTAMQMVLDLEGKFDLENNISLLDSNENNELDEAMEALSALGYRASELKKVRTKLEKASDTTEGYIKSALKIMMN
jgi:Holliday junction DNA helicase, RuvA subunit